MNKKLRNILVVALALAGGNGGVEASFGPWNNNQVEAPTPHRYARWTEGETALLLSVIRDDFEGMVPQGAGRPFSGDERRVTWQDIAARCHERDPQFYRDAHQCRDRYVNYLVPGLRRERWTPEEDARLIELHEERGSRWSSMVRQFPGRNSRQLESRWRSPVLQRQIQHAAPPSPVTSGAEDYESEEEIQAPSSPAEASSQNGATNWFFQNNGPSNFRPF